MEIAKPELKAEAVRLRLEKRLSLREIETITGAARGSLSLWLKPDPLSDEEKRDRTKLAKRYTTPKESRRRIEASPGCCLAKSEALPQR